MGRPGTLIVGDDAAATLLREEGHDVLEVPDTLQFLAIAEDHEVDAGVLDLALGPLSASDVFQKIKKNQTFMPILGLTARTDVVTRVEALRAGAADVLVRPFDPRELLARVEVLLRTSWRVKDSGRGRETSLPHEDHEHDRLTGLGNGRFLTRRLEDELQRAVRVSETLSVMAVDVDGLDEVNSRYGRGAGDRLLVACARAVERVCRDEDTLTRAGGDELVAILPRLHCLAAAGVAERLRHEMSSTAILDAGSRIACQVSVGVACFPGRDIESSNDLLRFANAALARAKAEGRGQVCLYQHQGYLIEPPRT